MIYREAVRITLKLSPERPSTTMVKSFNPSFAVIGVNVNSTSRRDIVQSNCSKDEDSSRSILHNFPCIFFLFVTWGNVKLAAGVPQSGVFVWVTRYITWQDQWWSIRIGPKSNQHGSGRTGPNWFCLRHGKSNWTICSSKLDWTAGGAPCQHANDQLVNSRIPYRSVEVGWSRDSGKVKFPLV